ncbi:energy transducer TonB [Desulfurivibrio sp. C05AmB]|uniref:energy transducer TonB n=1 Tax=Desulfurivibrio sp. C05AmB TaxID=3374371 RepID=UPI00376EFF5E
MGTETIFEHGPAQRARDGAANDNGWRDLTLKGAAGGKSEKFFTLPTEVRMSEQGVKTMLVTKCFLACLVLLFLVAGTVVHAEEAISALQRDSSPIIILSQTDVRPFFSPSSHDLDKLDQLRQLRNNSQLVPRKADMFQDATREYLIQIHQHINSYWLLTDQHTLDKNLMAVIVITITRDGTIRDFEFEKRPANVQFSHLVLETVLNAMPLPPFSAAMQQGELNIGLRFRPGKVF